jgi:hypothetical protein
VGSFERSSNPHQNDLNSRTSQSFQVTRERIRQIEAKALRKLRQPSRSRKLKAFVDGVKEVYRNSINPATRKTPRLLAASLILEHSIRKENLLAA